MTVATSTTTNNTTTTNAHETLSPVQLQRHYRALLRKELADVRRTRKAEFKEELVELEVEVLTSMSASEGQASAVLQQRLAAHKLAEPAQVEELVAAQTADHAVRMSDAMKACFAYRKTVAAQKAKAKAKA